MPRLTYEPSESSAAARAAISLRVRAISVALHADRAPLDALFDIGSDLDDAVDEDARQVDAVGVELPRLHELLDLCDAHATGHRRQRVEVAGGLVEDEIAET